MNSNLEKFFHGIGEGHLQSSTQESRRRDVAFAGPDKRGKNQLRQQREQQNQGATVVMVIATVWVAIFLGFVVAAIFKQ
jgi:hypothetical protein